MMRTRTGKSELFARPPCLNFEHCFRPIFRAYLRFRRLLFLCLCVRLERWKWSSRFVFVGRNGAGKSSKRRRHFVFFGISDRFDLKVRENLVYCAVEIKHSSDLRTN